MQHEASVFLRSFSSLSACQSSEPPSEKIQHDVHGNVNRRYLEVEGKKEGKMTDYFPDGTVMGERFFENDRQTGRTVLYFPSGKVREVQYYKNGLREGGDTLFYENGKPEMVLSFFQEKKHGYVRKWSSDGALVFEAKYEMDSLVEVKGEKIRTIQGPQ